MIHKEAWQDGLIPSQAKFVIIV